METIISDKQNEKLCDFVEKGCMTNIRICLRKGADPTKVGSNGMTAIGLAAMKGNYGILSRLLSETDQGKQKKMDLSEYDTTPDGMEGLEWDDEIDSRYCFSPDKEWLNLYTYYARMWENFGDMLTTASKIRDDPHCLDYHHYAPIHYAAKHGHMICVKLLLDYKCPVDAVTHAGKTALHIACEFQHKSVVELLIRYNANLNQKTFKSGDFPLLIAARNGNTEIVSMLLNAGALVDECNLQDVTPLMEAIQMRNVSAAKLLIESGANINLQDREGLSPLCLAVMSESVELVRLLLERNCRIVLSHNLLHKSIAANNNELIKLLVEAGDNVNARDSFGLSAFEKLITFGNEEMVLFLSQYAPKSATCSSESTEIFMAVNIQSKPKFQRMLNLLLHLNSDIDATLWNETPLSATIRVKQYDYARILIREGCSVRIPQMGNAVELLRRDGTTIILKYLINAGLRVWDFPDVVATIKAPPWGANTRSVEQYLAFSARNPLSLQQLARIRIRDALRQRMKSLDKVFRFSSVVNSNVDYTSSMFEECVQSLGLPPRLAAYVYRFSDLE
ncbi:putative ankyrin repeat protein RF_0381 [Phlebotomus argentipes]|uniref:putative ankyrin repeat protein RF_0381 n=1 Tax=Phlebotomus argentipes TaxID=94469 RepID=UPI002892D75F|nr:putative ankyrin repeat protein RF_0381 [Phlebotomus argentipes]